MDFNALIEANKQLQLHRAYDANLLKLQTNPDSPWFVGYSFSY